MGKITMQDVADALGISRVTVWKVFNNHTGVSAALRESVLEKAKELGYLKNSFESVSHSEEKTVSLIVSRPDSSTFWTNIIHRMAQELSHYNVNLMYTYFPSTYIEGFAMPSILTSDAIHGAIVLNVYDARLIASINDLDIPKVFLDTVPQINTHQLRGDLILLEGYYTLYQITESVLARNPKRVGFIGDINYAKTNLDRYHGFCQCMKDHHFEIDDTICLTQSIGIFSYDRELNAFLDSLAELPDAFICVSDYIAHFLQMYFSEHAERIPDGILVTGYDGSREYSNIAEQITTADVKTSLLGKRLSVQIVYRMEHPGAPFEQTFIYPEIIYRDSILH